MDQIDRLVVWFRRLFNKQGQRFCIGEIVTHNEGWRAKVLKARCYDNKWDYEVFWRGRGTIVFDNWEDWEIQ